MGGGGGGKGGNTTPLKTTTREAIFFSDGPTLVSRGEGAELLMYKCSVECNIRRQKV